LVESIERVEQDASQMPPWSKSTSMTSAGFPVVLPSSWTFPRPAWRYRVVPVRKKPSGLEGTPHTRHEPSYYPPV